MAETAQATSSWRRLLWPVALALVVRLLTLAPGLHTPPFSDEREYHLLASRLAAGQGYTFENGKATSWRAPLWPGVMAALYAVSGPSPAAARLLQVVLGTLLVAVVVAVAAALGWRDPRVPWFAGWWAALSPNLIYYSHSLFGETLFGLVLGLALLALLKARTGSDGAVLAGVALGLAALCRGSIVVLVPPVLVWLAGSHVGGWRAGLKQAALAGLLFGLTLLPWSARNFAVHGGFMLVDSNGPVNLFFGNHPRAPRWRPWEVVELADRPWPQVRQGASELELQRQAIAETALFVRARPLRFATGIVVKSGNLWGLSRGLASGVNNGLYGRRSLAKLALATLLDGIDGLALLVLGVLGLALLPNRAPAELQVLLMLSLTLVHAVSYGHSRYRFGALPLLFGLAVGALLSRAPGALSALPRARRRLALAALALLVVNFVYEVVVLELWPRLA